MLLATDGIFPIIKDKNGHLLEQGPASGLSFPGTVQGEGKLSGVPSLFIRLAGCNLQCNWTDNQGRQIPCDTAYAAYHVTAPLKMTVEDIYETILQNSVSIRHVVITGGEPFLQAAELKLLCQKLKQGNRFHLTIETNATLFNREVAEYIDLFSLSPKLPGSQATTSLPSLNPDCVRTFVSYAIKAHKDFQLKFVYSAENDITVIHDLLSQLAGWRNEDILLMPLGCNSDEMRTNTAKTLEHCIRNGWRYCDRLHISLFGDKRGV